MAPCRFRNQFSFRHSSRKQPLKLSMNAFCVGLPTTIGAGRFDESEHQLAGALADRDAIEQARRRAVGEHRLGLGDGIEEVWLPVDDLGNQT